MNARLNAKKLIDDVDEILDDHRVTHSDEHAWQYAQATATQATAQATLALAEQQRIANLIALWTAADSDVESLMRYGVNFAYIIDEIREGLGI